MASLLMLLKVAFWILPSPKSTSIASEKFFENLISFILNFDLIILSASSELIDSIYTLLKSTFVLLKFNAPKIKNSLFKSFSLFFNPDRFAKITLSKNDFSFTSVISIPPPKS